ncbi:MAG: class I adenylate-forming enzyme family protein [bacterium]
MDPVLENLPTIVGRALRVLHRTGFARTFTLAGAAEAARLLAAGEKLGPSTLHTLHAINFPDQTALVQGSERVSYGELERRINRAAHAFLAMGVRPGDRVALMMKNGIPFIEATYGLFRIRASAVNVSYHLKPRELSYILDHSGSRALIFGAEQAPVALEVRGTVKTPAENFVPTSAVDATLATWETRLAAQPTSRPARVTRDASSMNFVYTSGTTGAPKGAVRDMTKTGMTIINRILEGLPFRHADRHLVVAPLYHSGAQAFLHLMSGLGAEIHLLEAFDAELALKTLCDSRIHHAFLVPTMAQRILNLPTEVLERHRPRDLTGLVFGAAPFPAELRKRVMAYFGDVAYDFYGSTETGWVTLANPQDIRRHPDSVGKAIAGNDVKILDEARNELPREMVGELFVRNAMTIEHYHDDPDATARSQHGGFFSVGDLARIDPEGYIFLAGRKVDMVISGGVNLYPAEIEDVLRQHPAVEDCAIIGVPDDAWGEALVAYVVRRAGHAVTRDELIDHCARELARFKKPKDVRFIDQLPRNPTGKVLKRELRERYATEPAAEDVTAAAPATPKNRARAAQPKPTRGTSRPTAAAKSPRGARRGSGPRGR